MKNWKWSSLPLTRAPFACSSRIVIIQTSRRMLLVASCLPRSAIRLIPRNPCASTKPLGVLVTTKSALISTFGIWASLVRIEINHIGNYTVPSIVRRLTCSLLGETLLVQLGTANPGKTSEQKQQWNDGLRGVLNDLRKRRIKDPSGIAAEITKYRREFLNDDTRVVNL